MATIVKLTYTATGKATLVNMDTMSSAFRIFERTTRKYATRLNFTGEQYVVVDEELQEIMRLVQEQQQGNYQATDWVQIDDGDNMGDINNNFEGRIHDDYQRHTGQRQRPYQSRPQYNNNYNNRY